MSPDVDTAVAIAQMSDTQILRAAKRMEDGTSSFAHHLGSLYFCASPANRHILLNAFGHVFLDFKEN